jgi:aryl-alcohol dehydrogenase-like predicted oxidoreductase
VQPVRRPKVFADRQTARADELPTRTLGRTGAKVSIVGFPGLALTKCDQATGTHALHAAFETGVNYFDVAPAYGNGDAEIKMGVGLQGLDRNKYFLACKTHKQWPNSP